MFTKLINYLASTNTTQNEETQPPLTKKELKLQEMIKLIDQNEYFQHPEKLKEDLSYLIENFSNDKIDIYIDVQDESILHITGFIDITLKKKIIQIALYFTFHLSYPEQICEIKIENQSLINREIKLSTFYTQQLSEKFISLNSYLIESKIWLNHKSLDKILQELKIFLAKNFPFYKPKKQELFFTPEMTTFKEKSTEQSTIENQNQQNQQISENIQQKIQNSEEVQLNQKLISPPLIQQQNKLIGPSGLLLTEENNLQQKVTKFSIETMRQHRNEIVSLKQQQQEMITFKQQQEGLKNQLIWNRQQLDLALELYANQLGNYNKYFEEQKQQDNNKIIDELILFDDFSNQIVECTSKIKSLQDGFTFLTKSFRNGILEYNILIQVYNIIQFYLQLNYHNRNLMKNYQ